MNTQQPEALSLASIYDGPYGTTTDHKVAAELRRLHEVNTEMLEALREINSWIVCACIATPEDMAQNFPHILQVTEAAIAKATGGEA